MWKYKITDLYIQNLTNGCKKTSFLHPYPLLNNRRGKEGKGKDIKILKSDTKIENNIKKERARLRI